MGWSVSLTQIPDLKTQMTVGRTATHSGWGMKTQMVVGRGRTHSGWGHSFSSYHFLSCDGNGFGVFNHSRLVVNKCSLWFWRCAFIQLWIEKNSGVIRGLAKHKAVLLRIKNLGKIEILSDVSLVQTQF